MAKPYSMDLRERVVHAVERDGLSRQQAAARFEVASARRSTGSTGIVRRAAWRPARWAGGGRRSSWAGIGTGCCSAAGSATSRCAGWWPSWPSGACSVDYRVVWAFVHDEKLSSKKDADRQRAGSSRRGAPAPQWKAYQDRIDPSRLVFIDETWTKTNMAPLRGWARAANACRPRFRTAAGRP